MSEQNTDLENRVNLHIVSDNLTFDEFDVMEECARRFVEDQRRRRNRISSKSIESRAKIREQATARMTEAILGQLTNVVAEVRLSFRKEWDEDLLLSSFSIGAGVLVTWGEASAEQHNARADYLELFASGSLITAAMHREAASNILARGVETLLEVCRG